MLRRGMKKQHTKMNKTGPAQRTESQNNPRTGVHPAFVQERLQHEIQVHQVEIETQNHELRETQRIIEDSRDRYAELYDLAPVACLTLDEQGLIREANLSAAGLLGVERAALIGLPFHPYVEHADLPLFQTHLQKASDPGQPVRSELRLTGKNSRRPLVVMQSVSILNEAKPGRLCHIAITDITRSVQIQRESEDRFRQLAENIREVLWMTDPRKKEMIYVSPRYEATWGRTCESLYASPRNWLEAIHPEDRERVQKASLSKQISGEYDELYRIIRPDGSVRWIQDRAFPVRDDSGEVYRIVGIAEDITKRKDVEQALEESQARNKAVLHSALDAMISFDREGRIVEFNAAAERIFDCPRSQAVSQQMIQLVIPPSLRGWFQRGLAELFAGGEGPVQDSWIEMVARRMDSSEFPAECTITKIQLKGPPVFTAFIRDISKRKRDEEQIRLLADAVQSTAELISITDRENKFTFVNQAFLDAYGYHESEVLRRTPDFLYATENPPGFHAQVLEQTLRGGWHGEIVNRRKDRTTFPVSLSTSPLKMATGEILGSVGVARDISERKRAEKETLAFSQLGHRLNAATTPERAASIIMEIASELFGWDAGYVHLLTAEGDQAVPILTVDTVEGKRTHIPAGQTTLTPTPLMRSIMKEGARLINRPTDSQDIRKLVSFGDTGQLSASMMYVPIHLSGTVLGILSIQSYRVGAYSEHDLRLLQTLADHCGDALQRIKVANALREAEAKYRSIFENASEGIFQATPEGRFRSANPALARILGYSTPEELISGFTDMGREAHLTPKKWVELKQLLSARGSIQGFEAERLGKDGAKIWLSINAHIVYNSNGDLLYYEGTCQDITARKNTEAVLSESEEKFHALFDSAPIGIALHDASGKFLDVNRAYQGMVGYSADELKSLGVKRLTYSDDVAEGQQLFAELRAGTRDFYHREKRYLRKDGTQVWAESSASAVRDASGKLQYIISMVEDITIRKQAEDELRLLPHRIIEAQENERLRVGRELHDGVNQLIASAKMRLGRVQTLLAAQNPAASEIVSRCNRLLVQALAENRRIAYDLRPGDLDELGLAIACKHFCADFQARTTLMVKSQVPSEWSRLAPTVELNLFRIIQEALTNVEKHARAKTVWVRLAVQGEGVQLSIRDDGRGLAPDSRKAAKKRGSGLGLTNMRERAASAGGTCELLSAPNKGTRVIVRVPSRQAK